MKIAERIIDLSCTVVLECSCCGGALIEGRFFLEVWINEEPYVAADLIACCDGGPQPLIHLFDSQEPATEFFNRVVQSCKEGRKIFDLPLISRELAQSTFSGLFGT